MSIKKSGFVGLADMASKGKENGNKIKVPKKKIQIKKIKEPNPITGKMD